MPRVLPATLLATLACLVQAAPAAAVGDADVAALQVALRARGLYAGTVDGTLGEATAEAVRAFQRRSGLTADGLPGPQTRAALGRYGRRAPLGHRVLGRGHAGWDVASLQFLLAWHGFPSGTFDGRLGPGTQAALRRFQRWAGLSPDGWAGPGTIAALRTPLAQSPMTFTPPWAGPLGDGFGPRGARFHAGVDFTAGAGTPVTAAAAGRVTFAGWSVGGWGNLVVLAHGNGVRTLYAHLARANVRLGQTVATGAELGRVGSTGHSTGPHLHFEVRVRGAAVDPLPALRGAVT